MFSSLANSITLRGLVGGYCLPHKVALTAHSAPLIAKCLCVLATAGAAFDGYSRALYGAWKKTCRTLAPLWLLRKEIGLLWSKASRHLFGAIVSHLWKPGWSLAGKEQCTVAAVKILKCVHTRSWVSASWAPGAPDDPSPSARTPQIAPWSRK